MSEERSDRAGQATAGIWRNALIWGGGIAGLAVLAAVLLYAFGDPRPRAIDVAQVGGGSSTMPDVVADEDYFRIRAEFIPLPPASETRDPMGKAWAALFGDSVARSGAAEVRVIFDKADSQPLPAGGDDNVLLATLSDGPAKSATTAFFARRSGTTARVRLDVIRRKDGGTGILPALHLVFGSGEVQSSGWISVFPGDRAGGGGVLGPDTALRPVRDFTGRVVAAVRLGVEARRSIVFGEDFLPATAENLALERLILDNRTAEAMRAAVQGLIDRNLPLGFRDPAYRNVLSEQLDGMFSGGGSDDPASACRAGFARLSGELGLSATDAGLLAFLAWPGHREAIESGPACGDDRLHGTLASVGALSAATTVAAAIAREEEQRKLAEARVAAETAKAARTTRDRYVCLGTSGGRIEALCGVLNEIAGEWRSGVKFLNMKASRRHILENVGLEEPTLEMSYATGRIENRRQLLIHVALSKVENFACFRLVRRKPEYFEALVVISEGGAQAEPRLDVFEFAFNDDGRIARIRRRVAVSQDLDEAMALPETSRCRRQFLGDRAAALRRLIQRQWRLPATSG